jgi:hypothetical protein
MTLATGVRCRRRGLAPGCPETPHGAPIRGSCYGRENITVSHLHWGNYQLGFLGQWPPRRPYKEPARAARCEGNCRPCSRAQKERRMTEVASHISASLAELKASHTVASTLVV